MTRSRRRGYSLIECLVLMGAVAVVVGTTALLVHRLMEIDRSDRRAVAATETLERLARTLRGDAHAAAPDAKVEAAKVALATEVGVSVDYRVEAGRIVRTLHRADKTEHHDVFRLPDRTVARFEIRGESPAARRIALVLDRPDADARGRGPLKGLAIEAGLGRDRRHVREANGK